MPNLSQTSLHGNHLLSNCLYLLLGALITGFPAILYADHVFQVFLDKKPAGEVVIDTSTNFDQRTFNIRIGTEQKKETILAKRHSTGMQPVIYRWLLLANNKYRDADTDLGMRFETLSSGSKFEEQTSKWHYWLRPGNPVNKPLIAQMHPPESLSSASRLPHLLEYFLSLHPESCADTTSTVFDIAIYNLELTVTIREIHSNDTSSGRTVTLIWTANTTESKPVDIRAYFMIGHSKYKNGELIEVDFKAGISYKISYKRPVVERKHYQKPLIQVMNEAQRPGVAAPYGLQNTPMGNLDSHGSTASFSTGSPFNSGGSLFSNRGGQANLSRALYSSINYFSGSCNSLVHISTYFATINALYRL